MVLCSRSGDGQKRKLIKALNSLPGSIINCCIFLYLEKAFLQDFFFWLKEGVE